MILPYLRYFQFSGRSRRMEYWMFALFYWLVVLLISGLFGHTDSFTTNSTSISFHRSLTPLGEGIWGMFWLISIVPWLAVSVRRLHDQDRTGWLILLLLIPLFGWFALLVLMFFDGTTGDNRYGPDPKGRGDAEVFS